MKVSLRQAHKLSADLNRVEIPWIRAIEISATNADEVESKIDAAFADYSKLVADRISALSKKSATVSKMRMLVKHSNISQRHSQVQSLLGSVANDFNLHSIEDVIARKATVDAQINFYADFTAPPHISRSSEVNIGNLVNSLKTGLLSTSSSPDIYGNRKVHNVSQVTVASYVSLHEQYLALKREQSELTRALDVLNNSTMIELDEDTVEQLKLYSIL